MKEEGNNYNDSVLINSDPNNFSTNSILVSGNNLWTSPVLIDTIVNDDRIELVYKCYSLITYSSWLESTPAPRIYKDVYGSVDGKLQKIKTVEGMYIPATTESYEFDDNIE